MSNDETEADEEDFFASDREDFRTLLRSGDRDGLISALENPELLRLAHDDRRYTKLAMQGIAVLGWDEPSTAGELLLRYDATSEREQPESPARQAARALLMAFEWRQLEGRQISVKEMKDLRDYLRAYTALADEPEFGVVLREDLRQRPSAYADFFQKLVAQSLVLPAWILRLEPDPESKDASPVLGLSDAQVSALSEAAADVSTALKKRWSRYAVWGVVALALAAMPNAIGVLVALLCVGASMALEERRSYEQVVRPRLARLAAEHGVGAKHVVSWVYRVSRKAGRLGRFDIKIENDSGLDVLAALSRSLTSP